MIQPSLIIAQPVRIQNGNRHSANGSVARNTKRSQVYIYGMSPHNYADCVGNYCNAVLSGEIAAACWLSSG